MPHIPDLNDPRYRDEIGWFLFHEKYGLYDFDDYNTERFAYSRQLLDEILHFVGRDTAWLADKTVISIGCGCTGDLIAFPAVVKIGIDPLLYAYQKLRLLVPDQVGSPTLYLPLGAEHLPLLDGFADVIICRNALDHMPEPQLALKEMSRILKERGFFFASVDIGGEPTPDEPTVFSATSLRALLDEYFEVVRVDSDYAPHSKRRVCSTRVLAQKKSTPDQWLDKDNLLNEYMHAYESYFPFYMLPQRLRISTARICSVI
jgi:SAM-dependent methyltransferase